MRITSLDLTALAYIVKYLDKTSFKNFCLSSIEFLKLYHDPYFRSLSKDKYTVFARYLNYSIETGFADKYVISEYVCRTDDEFWQVFSQDYDFWYNKRGLFHHLIKNNPDAKSKKRRNDLIDIMKSMSYFGFKKFRGNSEHLNFMIGKFVEARCGDYYNICPLERFQHMWQAYFSKFDFTTCFQNLTLGNNNIQIIKNMEGEVFM